MNNYNPPFSVLLSVYHKESIKNIQDSLDSILKYQTILPTEIVLIKDGILPNEMEHFLVELKKQEPKIKIYGYKVNMGLGYALNFGLKKCANELVFRMDTDDIAIPERFSIQLELMRQNPEIAIIGSFIEEFDTSPKDINRFRDVPTDPESINKYKNLRNPFNHMTVAFRKSIIEKSGGYIDMPGYEDYYLWLRVLKYHKGLNINRSLVHARIGNNMISRRQGFSFFRKELNFQKRIFNDGLIDFFTFGRNIVVRCVPRLFPIIFLEICYKYILRK